MKKSFFILLNLIFAMHFFNASAKERVLYLGDHHSTRTFGKEMFSKLQESYEVYSYSVCGADGGTFGRVKSADYARNCDQPIEDFVEKEVSSGEGLKEFFKEDQTFAKTALKEHDPDMVVIQLGDSFKEVGDLVYDEEYVKEQVDLVLDQLKGSDSRCVWIPPTIGNEDGEKYKKDREESLNLFRYILKAASDHSVDCQVLDSVSSGLTSQFEEPLTTDGQHLTPDNAKTWARYTASFIPEGSLTEKAPHEDCEGVEDLLANEEIEELNAKVEGVTSKLLGEVESQKPAPDTDEERQQEREAWYAYERAHDFTRDGYTEPPMFSNPFSSSSGNASGSSSSGESWLSSLFSGIADLFSSFFSGVETFFFGTDYDSLAEPSYEDVLDKNSSFMDDITGNASADISSEAGLDSVDRSLASKEKSSSEAKDDKNDRAVEVDSSAETGLTLQKNPEDQPKREVSVGKMDPIANPPMNSIPEYIPSGEAPKISAAVPVIESIDSSLLKEGIRPGANTWKRISEISDGIYKSLSHIPVKRTYTDDQGKKRLTYPRRNACWKELRTHYKDNVGGEIWGDLDIKERSRRVRAHAEFTFKEMQKETPVCSSEVQTKNCINPLLNANVGVCIPFIETRGTLKPQSPNYRFCDERRSTGRPRSTASGLGMPLKETFDHYRKQKKLPLTTVPYYFEEGKKPSEEELYFAITDDVNLQMEVIFRMMNGKLSERNVLNLPEKDQLIRAARNYDTDNEGRWMKLFSNCMSCMNKLGADEDPYFCYIDMGRGVK